MRHAALICEGQTWNRESLDAAIEQVRLSTNGLLALAAPATPEVIFTLLAHLRSERAVLPLNPKFPPGYRDEILGRLGPRELPPPRPVDALVLTSGSSGQPRAAGLSLAQLECAARAANARIPLGPEDGWLLSLPLFHVSGLGVLCRCIDAGASIVVPEPGRALLDMIRQPEVTHVSLVATQLYRLLRAAGGAEALRGLKAILCGGSAFPPALLREAAAAELPLHMSFGMTETAALITATRVGEGLEAWQTAGEPLRADTVRVSDAGEIQVRGDTLFHGYFQEGVLDLPLTEDGWFPTGDLGAFDAQGRLLVLGRMGNRFIVGGENVQPEEVERALLQVPGVLRARVVALPDPEFVQVPVAFVDAPSFREAELREAASALLPRHAWPRRLFPWPEHLERDGEKISRGSLETEARRQVAEIGDVRKMPS